MNGTGIFSLTHACKHGIVGYKDATGRIIALCFIDSPDCAERFPDGMTVEVVDEFCGRIEGEEPPPNPELERMIGEIIAKTPPVVLPNITTGTFNMDDMDKPGFMDRLPQKGVKLEKLYMPLHVLPDDATPQQRHEAAFILSEKWKAAHGTEIVIPEHPTLDGPQLIQFPKGYHCLSCRRTVAVGDPSELPKGDENCSHEWEEDGPGDKPSGITPEMWREVWDRR